MITARIKSPISTSYLAMDHIQFDFFTPLHILMKLQDLRSKSTTNQYSHNLHNS